MSSMHPTFEHEECPSDFSGESPGKVASLAPFPFFTSQYSRYANMVSLGLLMCTLADLLGTGFWVQVGLKERSFAAPFFYLQNGDFQGISRAKGSNILSISFSTSKCGDVLVPIRLGHSPHVVHQPTPLGLQTYAFDCRQSRAAQLTQNLQQVGPLFEKLAVRTIKFSLN